VLQTSTLPGAEWSTSRSSGLFVAKINRYKTDLLDDRTVTRKSCYNSDNTMHTMWKFSLLATWKRP